MFREAGPLCIKDSLKEDARLFAFGFWLFDVGGFGRENDC
jgi:hypothetical protein